MLSILLYRLWSSGRPQRLDRGEAHEPHGLLGVHVVLGGAAEGGLPGQDGAFAHLRGHLRGRAERHYKGDEDPRA